MATSVWGRPLQRKLCGGMCFSSLQKETQKPNLSKRGGLWTMLTGSRGGGGRRWDNERTLTSHPKSHCCTTIFTLLYSMSWLYILIIHKAALVESNYSVCYRNIFNYRALAFWKYWLFTVSFQLLEHNSFVKNVLRTESESVNDSEEIVPSIWFAQVGLSVFCLLI